MTKLNHIFAVISLVFCLCLSSCLSRHSNSQGKGNSEATRPPITADKAIEIAKNTIAGETDVNMLDPRVAENPNSWTVSFALKEQYKHWHGGEADVEVDKQTGEVLRYYIGK